MSKTPTVERLYNLSGHSEPVYGLAAGADASFFYSAAGDGMVVEWNLQKPETGKLLLKVPSSIYALHRDEFRNELIIGQNYDGIRIYDLESRKEVKSVKLTTSAIFDIKTVDNQIFVGTGDGVIIVVDRESFAVKKHIKASDKSVRAMAINPFKKLLAVAYSDFHIRWFNLVDFTPVASQLAHENSVFTLQYSSDYSKLLSGSRDARLKIWEEESNFQLHESIVAHMYAINHIQFSPDGQHFVTCSMDKSIKLWASRSFRLLKVIDKSRHAGHGTSVNRVLWTAKPGIIISASDDRSISVWKINLNPE